MFFVFLEIKKEMEGNIDQCEPNKGNGVKEVSKGDYFLNNVLLMEEGQKNQYFHTNLVRIYGINSIRNPK